MLLEQGLSLGGCQGHPALAPGPTRVGVGTMPLPRRSTSRGSQGARQVVLQDSFHLRLAYIDRFRGPTRYVRLVGLGIGGLDRGRFARNGHVVRRTPLPVIETGAQVDRRSSSQRCGRANGFDNAHFRARTGKSRLSELARRSRWRRT
jgi:hypothetical protein